jgi:beta-galactosidase
VRNIVNAFTSKESWKYIHYMEKDKGMEYGVTMELPRKETVKEISIILTTHYNVPQKMKIYFSPDGSNPAEPMEFALVIDNSLQSFDISPAVETDYLRLEFSDLTTGSPRDIIGVDNLRVAVQRSKEFEERVHPLLNIGGLVRYEFGKGGLFLNQLNILETESNPVNRQKKAAIVKTTLGNLGVPFTGGHIIVAGANLDYTPVKIQDEQYNAFMDHQHEPRWFRNSKHPGVTLANLPDGDQRLAGVLFRINNFYTSPVTSAIMLAGAGSEVKEERVPNLEVGTKADALFFLHAYHPSRELALWEPNPRNDETEPPDLFVYRVRYVDGQTAEIPIRWKRDIDDWLMEDPRSLPMAYLAWKSNVEGEEDVKKALYAFQWSNPRPDITIESIEMALDDPQSKRWGAPVLVAVTAASAAENGTP